MCNFLLKSLVKYTPSSNFSDANKLHSVGILSEHMIDLVSQ